MIKLVLNRLITFGLKYPSMHEPILANPRKARELLPCSNRSLDGNAGEKCYHTICC